MQCHLNLFVDGLRKHVFLADLHEDNLGVVPSPEAWTPETEFRFYAVDAEQFFEFDSLNDLGVDHFFAHADSIGNTYVEKLSNLTMAEWQAVHAALKRNMSQAFTRYYRTIGVDGIL